MDVLINELEKQVLNLTAAERSRLADLFLESLKGPPISDIEDAWRVEIKARLAALEKGTLKTFSAEDVFAKFS